MTELILSPLLDVIFGNLASAAMEELRLAWGVDKELNNLKSTLSAIQAVLEDAEDRQFESKAVKDWLRKLEDVAYDADDLVDDMATEAQQSIMESTTESGHRTMKQQVCNFLPSCFGCGTPVGYRREMAHRIGEIHEQLDMIAKQKDNFQLQTRPASKPFEIREGRGQPVSSVRDESEIFGRQKDREQIIEYLLSDDSWNRRKFSVVAIVGMGGQGKSTLAQLVYNDSRVTSKFELRAWVCVSEDFDVIRLTKEIIESATKSSCDMSSIDVLQTRLHEILNGRRFLLVLDDVWNENSSCWDKLQAPFAFGATGSKIIVTTRSQSVSAVTQPRCTYNLKGLSNEDCWALFASRAFVHDAEEDMNACYPRLVEIGRKLAEKCQGLPLAAKALGGLLSSSRAEKEWENIMKSKTWELHGAGGEILPALRLSYQHLPVHLKRCFTFCSIYEKDHRLVREKIVKMWIAHGFVRGRDGEQIEGTGSRYFNDLVQRSFFHPSTYGEGKYYTMHDLFHDLARSLSGNECFHTDDFKQLHGVPRKVRHLSLKLKDDEDLSHLEVICELRSLRTLLLSGDWFLVIKFKLPSEMFNCLKFLRVLKLSCCDMPDSIGNLRHLRYLKYKNGTNKELPDSICNIYNLQTLVLFRCDELVKLPNGTSNLINLRHLEVKYCSRLESTPPGIGRLTCLRNLSLFVVGREEHERGIAQLKNLTQLSGSLEIRNLEQVEEAEAARQANLKSKPFIEDLQLTWSYRDPTTSIDESLEEEVAEGLQPHPNLKKITFHGYWGTRFPSWMMKMGTDILLSNLTTVVLDGCRRCSILPPLGQLTSLANLRIREMDELKQIEEGQFLCVRRILIGDCPQLIFLPRFPSLEELYLSGLDNLEDWCGVGEADFQNLRRLRVVRCPKLTKWPPNHLSALTDLEVSDCWGFDSFPLLPSLSRLEIGKSSDKLWNSVSFPTSLSSLRLMSLQLTAVHGRVLRALTQLKSWIIHGCDGLETLLVGDDGSLQQQNGGFSLTLTHLLFVDCVNLKLLPRGLHALTSLQSLQIVDCTQVESLPEEGLPTGLQTLNICGCPKLKERCCKDTGEDWPKVAGIPHLRIVD